MKKTAICLMAALGMTAVSLTSCDSSCKPVKELANASDSLVYAVGVLLSCFNTATSLIPLFFPRIAIAFKPLFINREKKVVKK